MDQALEPYTLSPLHFSSPLVTPNNHSQFHVKSRKKAMRPLTTINWNDEVWEIDYKVNMGEEFWEETVVFTICLLLSSFLFIS